MPKAIDDWPMPVGVLPSIVGESIGGGTVGQSARLLPIQDEGKWQWRHDLYCDGSLKGHPVLATLAGSASCKLLSIKAAFRLPSTCTQTIVITQMAHGNGKPFQCSSVPMQSLCLQL
jgi:hypothetical protein